MARRALAFALLLACKSDAEAPAAPHVEARTEAAAEPGASCPTEPLPSTRAPGTEDRHDAVQTWLAGEDAQVEIPVAVEELNTRSAEIPGAWRNPRSRDVALPEAVNADIEERLAYLDDMISRGTFVEGEAGSVAAARSITQRATPVDHFRILREESALYCIPLHTGLYKEPVDKAFDRNACASLHPGERVRVLRRGPKGAWLHVHAGHTVGWLHQAAVTPRLSDDDLVAWEAQRRIVPLRDGVTTDDGFGLRLGVSLPLVARIDDGWRVLVPDKDGVHEATIPGDADVAEGFPPLRRDLLLKAAFSELGAPYGWGGRAGERDCSRYLRDLFATFGIQLARHSGVQAKLGTQSIDVEGKSDEAKRAQIREAAQRGVVLLYMKGHIMLYLGQEGDRDYAISSISEYLEPCEGGPDTVHRIDRVAVTTLELGRDTERTAFIERISRLVVFG